MDNDDSDAHNTYVDLETLDAAELAPLSASILTYFHNYAEFLKNPDGNPFAKGILETYVDAETWTDIVNYVDNITYRHVGGDRFEVSFDLNLPDSNNGEPNLKFSNDDKEAQRDNIFGILINSVEHYNDESIEYGDEIMWTVAASEDAIDYTRFHKNNNSSGGYDNGASAGFGGAPALFEYRNATALEILELNNTASNENIKKAYYRLARIHHPDKGGNTKTFQTIQDAYNKLTKKGGSRKKRRPVKKSRKIRLSY
jgi:hypothetical protein